MLQGAGPLKHGDIFVVFNLHHELDAVAAFAELRRQATRVIELGFDGVALSEHHGGFPGYLPNPLQAAGLLLAGMPRGWVGGIPIILPLRSPVAIVEEAAWLDAAYPGRVVVGFAAGYVEADFTAFGVPFATRFPQFRKMFSDVADGLHGVSGVEMLRQDPAVAAALAIRFQIGPLPASAVREQIDRFGAEVLPALRQGLREIAASEHGAAS